MHILRCKIENVEIMGDHMFILKHHAKGEIDKGN
jgi:hypothetical protein